MFASHRYLVSPGIGVSIPVFWGTAQSVQTTRGQQIPGIMDWQPARASSRDSLTLRAAKAFASRLSSLSQVVAVAVDLDDKEPRITTFLERRDVEVRNRIYDIEFEICRELGMTGVDFRVVSMDNSACIIPGDDVSGTKVVYRRGSRDHA